MPAPDVPARGRMPRHFSSAEVLAQRSEAETAASLRVSNNVTEEFFEVPHDQRPLGEEHWPSLAITDRGTRRT
jgi:hypothetical protein